MGDAHALNFVLANTEQTQGQSEQKLSTFWTGG
jgi:hypothetical protein